MSARIPRHLHLPTQFMALLTVEVAMLMVGYFLFLVIGHWSIAVAAVSVVWAHVKFRERFPRGYLGHLLWSLGFAKLDGYPSPTSRSFEE